MNVLMMMLSDPVVWSSLLVIGCVCGMAGYYTYLFLQDDEKHNQH